MLVIQQILNMGPALKSLVIFLGDVSFIRGKVNRNPESCALKSKHLERTAGAVSRMVLVALPCRREMGLD